MDWGGVQVTVIMKWLGEAKDAHPAAAFACLSRVFLAFIFEKATYITYSLTMTLRQAVEPRPIVATRGSGFPNLLVSSKQLPQLVSCKQTAGTVHQLFRYSIFVLNAMALRYIRQMVRLWHTRSGGDTFNKGLPTANRVEALELHWSGCCTYLLLDPQQVQ